MDLFDIAVARKLSGGGGSEPVIEPLSVTDNGTYSAPSGVDGYSPVTVDVGGGGGLEIVKAISYDKLLVQDEGITIPNYTTTATTLASSTTGDAIALDRDNYVYSVASVGLVYPIYNNFADASGKFEFSVFAAGSEYLFIPANTIASQSGKKYTNSIGNLVNETIQQYFVYHSSALSQTTTATGVYANPANPQISSSAGTITLKAPGIYIKGSTASYKQAAWEATADIRCQYQVCLFKQRIDASEKTRLTLDGLLLHAINCFNSQSHTLTEIYS